MVRSDTLLSFIVRHKFRLHDFLDPRSDLAEHLKFNKLFCGREWILWNTGNESRRRLSIALFLGSYMAEYGDGNDDMFAQLSSMLHQEEWEFALRFCPYHHVIAALNNLSWTEAAMDEAYLGLNTALAGLEVSSIGGLAPRDIHERERAKATTSLLMFTALYASYIDGCRRVRALTRLDSRRSYERALHRLLRKNIGQHAFIKALRNFNLHYYVAKPYVVIRFAEARVSRLLLDCSDLLYSGYKWNEPARDFLSASPQVDVIDTAYLALKDVRRVIRFHRKLARTHMRREKNCYDSYVKQRRRHDHLQRAAVDVGAAFKQPTTILSRILREDIVSEIIESSLAKEEMRSLIMRLSDRHSNLPDKAKVALAREVDHCLRFVTEPPDTGPYLQGRIYR